MVTQRPRLMAKLPSFSHTIQKIQSGYHNGEDDIGESQTKYKNCRLEVTHISFSPILSHHKLSELLTWTAQMQRG